MTSGLLAVVLPRWMRYICFCVDVLLHMHSVPSLDLFFCGLFLPCISEEMKLCPFHSVLNTFSLRADLSCVLIWVVGLKSLQVSWKNRWLGRWEQESLFALLLPLASQLNPLVIGLWEDVCPSFTLLLLADLCSAPVGYFFYPGLSEKKVVPFSEVQVFPSSQRSSEGMLCSLSGLLSPLGLKMWDLDMLTKEHWKSLSRQGMLPLTHAKLV